MSVSVIRFTRVAALATVALVGVAGLAACSSSSSAAGSGSLDIVAGENFWGDIAHQLGGDAVHVTSILSDPNTDPHEYESSAKNAASVAEAALVITNGVGYDDFMDKLLQASPNGSRAVVNVADVVKPTGDNPNPHLWYHAAYVLQAAQAIADAITHARPAAKASVAANLSTFDASMQGQVVDVVDQIKAKYAGEKIAYTERVPGYLIQDAGLSLGTPASFSQAIEDGNEPTPGDVETFDSALADHTVKVLLYNAQVTSPATTKLRALAETDQVPVVPVTETLPASAANFQAWQHAQAVALLTALGG